MKNFKRITGIALVLIMVLGMAMTAFAAVESNKTDCTITVNGAQIGETYKAYKMMDLYVSADRTAFAYTVNSEWVDFFIGENAPGAAYVDIDDQGYVSWAAGKNTADEMVAFGKAAAKFAAEKNITATATEEETQSATVTFSSLESGYYLVTSTNGTLAIVDTTPENPERTISEKNANPTIDKKVKEDSTGIYGTDNNSAQIGDTVEFEVTIHAKKGAKNYVLHDTMDNGLTLNADSIAIAGLTKDTHYTVNTNPGNGETFTITFTENYLNSITADTDIVVTYSAELNQNAADLAGEKNTAKLTWGDNSSVEETTTTNTFKFEVLKYAKGDAAKKNLAGAVFELHKAGSEQAIKLVKINEGGTEYRIADDAELADDQVTKTDTFTTVADENIVIYGVDTDADYTLVETAAPAGYNMLSEPFAIGAITDSTLVAEVENSTGAELPSTGGIGTTIFYIVGSCLVLGAAVLLITKKRMSKNN